jgi:DNA-directed RNA polymerase subunit D
MFDEYIAHRIGLVPILTPKDYDEKDEIVFSLEAEGPGTVYSKEMKSSDKSVKVANDAIPIIKLAEGQRIRVDGKAVMGNGKRSAKFQPGIVSYKTKNGTDYEFYFESFGQMNANEIMKRALDIISSGLKDVHKELKK